MTRRGASHLYALLPLCAALAAREASAGVEVRPGVELRSSVAHDLSAPLPLMPPAEQAAHVEHEPRPFRRFPPSADSAAPAAASAPAGPASAAAVPGLPPRTRARPGSQTQIPTLGATVFRDLADGISSPDRTFSVPSHATYHTGH